MICLNCGVRYAPYPRKDFNFDGEAIVIINEGAEERRSEVYESDEEKLCGVCRCGAQEIQPV